MYLHGGNIISCESGAGSSHTFTILQPFNRPLLAPFSALQAPQQCLLFSQQLFEQEVPPPHHVPFPWRHPPSFYTQSLYSSGGGGSVCQGSYKTEPPSIVSHHLFDSSTIISHSDIVSINILNLLLGVVVASESIKMKGFCYVCFKWQFKILLVKYFSKIT